MGRLWNRNRRWLGALAAAMLAATGVTVIATRASAATVAPAATVVSAATTTPALGGYLHTSGSKILNASNQVVQIKAANWFGLETSNCTVHGLWSISLDSGMAQIAAWGFNALRLPWSDGCLTAPANSIDATKNPTLQGKTGLQVMDAVIASAKAHGLKVILDRHRPDTGSQSELWYTSTVSETQWINDWVMLAHRYAKDDTVIGADLHNEPHGGACWACGDPTRDWAAAATRAGNAVLAANPNLLIVVEGVEKSANGQTYWWGGNLQDAAAHPISLAVAGRLIYSAHDYPATVYQQTWFTDPTYPSNLPAVWDHNWGYLIKNNIAPVWLGEFGTLDQTTSDQKWLAAMVGYLKTNNISFAYWSFNPDSGDTGGLLQDDWVTPQTAKLTALAPLLGGVTGPATSTPSSPSNPAPTPSSPVSSPVSAPVTTPPAPTSSPTATTSGTSTTQATTTANLPGGAGVSATWTLNSAWGGGYVAQLTVTPISGPVGSWTVSWPDLAATSIANSWGLTCTVRGGRISCTGAGWATAIPAGQTVTVGLQVNSSGVAPSNPTLTTTGHV